MTGRKLDADYQNLFDMAPCGYVLVGADNVILMANDWMSSVLGYPPGEVAGKHLRDILSMPARILWETNLAPLLRLQDSIREVTLDLKNADGNQVPVIMGATCRREPGGDSPMTRMVFLEAGERRLYERELVSVRDHAQQKLRQEQHDRELREQFIAVLGHDLRNPLAALLGAVKVLSREPLSDRGRQVLDLTKGSILRMSGIIDNVMDFARARLGGGIRLELRLESTLEPLIEQVVQELKFSFPEHDIQTHYVMTKPVLCDLSKIGQLLSNLIGNALAHGEKGQPVIVRAETTVRGSFCLAVSNGGEPICDEAMRTLFKPFVRGNTHGYKDGLGLGLFIAHEIAVAHRGSLTAISTEEETRFTFEVQNGNLVEELTASPPQLRSNIEIIPSASLKRNRDKI